MKFFSMLIIMLSFSICSAGAVDQVLANFKSYRVVMEKNYNSSLKVLEKAKTDKAMDAYLNQHEAIIEKLFFAEMLPLKKSEISKFCGRKTYLIDAAIYYNLSSQKDLLKIKKPDFIFFIKFVRHNCAKLGFGKKRTSKRKASSVKK